LSDVFRCDYQFFISNDKTGPFEETEFLFRRYGSEFRKEDRWAVQEFLYLCACEEFLNQELGRPPSVVARLSSSGQSPRAQAMRAAAALRKLLGYDKEDLQRNIYIDLRKLGIHVFRRHLGNSHISGLTIRTPNAGTCILVNYDEDPYRQRFSAAHEVCHALLDSDEGVVVSLSREKRSDIEVRANYFASYFLMPPEIIRSIQSGWSNDEIVKWANSLQVSVHALSIALKREGRITPDRQAALTQIRVPKALKRDPELPADLTDLVRSRKEHFLKRGLSNYYVGLCFDAYERGIISAARAAEMLLADFSELGDLATIFGRSVKRGD
jgi:Zn-dependent peptidase ImmA (M78 family)